MGQACAPRPCCGVPVCGTTPCPHKPQCFALHRRRVCVLSRTQRGGSRARRERRAVWVSREDWEKIVAAIWAVMRLLFCVGAPQAYEPLWWVGVLPGRVLVDIVHCIHSPWTLGQTLQRMRRPKPTEQSRLSPTCAPTRRRHLQTVQADSSSFVACLQRCVSTPSTFCCMQRSLVPSDDFSLPVTLARSLMRALG